MYNEKPNLVVNRDKLEANLRDMRKRASKRKQDIVDREASNLVNAFNYDLSLAYVDGFIDAIDEIIGRVL